MTNCPRSRLLSSSGAWCWRPARTTRRPDKLDLTSAAGKPASGLFLLTAVNGPVSQYLVEVPAAVADRVKVSPVLGSLPAGGNLDVTVTVTSKTALTTRLTLEPGNLTVQVTYQLKT
jgi:hypothetical protein